MILCAGKGTRLGELTKKTPKALLSVGGKPIVEHILDWLKRYEVSDIVINLHHLGGKIQDYLGNGSAYGVDIKYTFEDELLGTAGGVKNAGVFLTSPFVVVNGDTLANFNLLSMLGFHQNRQALVTIALAYTNKASGVGIVDVDEFGKLQSFTEKPSHKLGGLFNAGVYILEKEIFDYIPDGFCDFGYDVFPALIEARQPVYGYVLGNKDYVIDIGVPEGYEKAKEIYGE